MQDCSLILKINHYFFIIKERLNLLAGTDEGTIHLDNIRQVRGLRIIIKDAVYSNEYMQIKLGLFGNSAASSRRDFGECLFCFLCLFILL